MSTLRVCLFGGLVLSRDGTPLPPITSTAARSLLAYLLTYRERPHTRDLLAGTFWPDLPDATARRRLSQALWQIRKALEPLPILVAEGDTVQIDPDLPLWLDLEEFTRHKAQCTEDGPGALEHCELCLEHYRGDFLAGYYDDWALLERERLREVFLEVLDRLLVGYKRRGDYPAALVHARRLAEEDPWREAVHREVMRLCQLLGRDAEALKHFETCRRVLAEELGAEPSAETAALAREIAARSDQAALPDLPQAAPPPLTLVLDGQQAFELPLVGREAERAGILTHVEALFQGLGAFVLLEGEAGVGKTRLLRAIAQDAEWRGAETLWGNEWQAGASAPYGALVEALSGGLSLLRVRQLVQLVDEIWLQTLSALLPALAAALPDLGPPPALEPRQERDRLVNALARLLAGWAQIVPLLLVVEDLHWAGQDTLDLLARLVPLLGGSRVLVLGSYRGEEARAQAETWQKLQALDRAAVGQRLVLDRLDAAAAGELVRRSLGLGSPAPLFEARLFDETQGNPLFLLETLRALHGEGLLIRDQDGGWSTPWDDRTSDYTELPLPRAVEHIIRRRLDGLEHSLRQTVHLAAALGERFDFDLLRTASGEQAPDLLAAMRDLVNGRFLDETDEDYVFHHDRIRQVAYAGIEAGDRRRLHRQVAGALESLQTGRVAALAYHWTEGEVWDRAAGCHRQAGDRALAVHALARAADHYTLALEALARLPGEGEPALRYDLLLARERIHDLQGRREAQAKDLSALEGLAEAWDGPEAGQRRAEVALRRIQYISAMTDYALAISQVEDAIDLARAAAAVELEAEGQFLWARTLAQMGEWEQAQQRFHDLLAMAQQVQLPGLEAKASGYLAHLAVEQGNFAEVRVRGAHALQLFRKLGDPRGEAGVHGAMGLAALYQGDHAAAEAHFEQFLRLARETGNRSGEGQALLDLGFAVAEQGDLSRARSHYEQALQIFGEIGDRDHEGRVLNNLGFILSQLGAYAEAQALFERFLANSRQIGSRQGETVAQVNLSDVTYCQGQTMEAVRYGRQALQAAEELGERRAQGYTWTCLGNALAELGRPDEAAAAYRQALAVRRELGQDGLAMESLAGLARVALGQGDLPQACACTDEILERLQTHSLAGTKDPFLVHLTCYRVLHAARDPRAGRVLAGAYGLLQEQAARIADDDARRSYLHNVASQRELAATYLALEARSRKQVRLPRAGAPTGRPLREDEYVTMTWVVALPEDEALDGGPERRQARLLRLLQEAAEQGAAPTVGDLAAALAVSEPTVRRDLAALRRAGHQVRTRGSRGG